MAEDLRGVINETARSSGSVVPVRVGGREWPRVCLRGHDLRRSQGIRSWLLMYKCPEFTCGVCDELGDERATWAQIDPAVQVEHGDKRSDSTYCLALVVFPPDQRGGLGRIEARLWTHWIGSIAFAACGPCRRAVISAIEIRPDFRRLGFATVLLAAALARAPTETYSWSGSRPTTLEARAFWASIDFVNFPVDQPRYCTDMLRAAETRRNP